MPSIINNNVLTLTIDTLKYHYEILKPQKLTEDAPNLLMERVKGFLIKGRVRMSSEFWTAMLMTKQECLQNSERKRFPNTILDLDELKLSVAVEEWLL